MHGTHTMVVAVHPLMAIKLWLPVLTLLVPAQVSIVGFKKGQLRVLSHAWDRNLGGRDLDNVLFEHFAHEFQEKYKLDVRTNARASFRLRMACEKV